MSYLPPPSPAPQPVYQPSYVPTDGPTYLYEPSQEERTFGTLSHALQSVGWWIAPLVIFLTKRRLSRFVAFHSLQVLLFQLILLAGWLLTMTVWIGFFVSMIMHTKVGQAPPEPPPALMLLFPLIWLFGLGMWLAVLLLTIFYSIKAGRGEWAKYPVLGGLAARILKIDFSMTYQPVSPQYPSPYPPQYPPPEVPPVA